MKYFNFYTSQLFSPKDDEGNGTGTGSNNSEETDDSTEDGADNSEDGGSDEDDEDEGTDDEDEDNEDEEKLTPAQRRQAASLLKLVTDPTTRKNAILDLAKAAGVEIGEQTTKKEIQKDRKKVIEHLSEKLGADYKFLAEKLAPAIEAILDDEREDNKQAFSRVEDKQVENEINSATVKLDREFKGGFTRLYPQIIKLADDILPAAGVSTEAYLRKLYKLAASEGGSVTNSKKLADKINRNANDAGNRLANRGTGSGVKKLPENASYKEIAEFSAAQVASRSKQK